MRIRGATVLRSVIDLYRDEYFDWQGKAYDRRLQVQQIVVVSEEGPSMTRSSIELRGQVYTRRKHLSCRTADDLLVVVSNLPSCLEGMPQAVIEEIRKATEAMTKMADLHHEIVPSAGLPPA